MHSAQHSAADIYKSSPVGGDSLGNGCRQRNKSRVKMANKFHVVQRQNKDGRLGLPVCQLDTSGMLIGGIGAGT